MQNDWLLEGRAVDDRGQGTTWEWRDVDGSLPTPDDVAMLEGLMREDFTQVYGHVPTRVAVGWLPSCGVDSLYKLPTWREALETEQPTWAQTLATDDRYHDRGRRGLWVVDEEEGT